MTESDDSPLSDATWRALRENDDLLPTSDAEVERACAKIPEPLELPPRLRRYRGDAGPLPKRAGYLIAAAVGALAAAASILLWRGPPAVSVTSAGRELVRPSTSAETAAKVAIIYESRCERECCAGSDCRAPSPALAACPSGLRCIGCTTDNVHGGPYRLRVGAVIPSDAGQKLLPLGAPLELCVLSAAGGSACVPALGENGEAWRKLGAVTSLQDLLTGLTIELRKRGQAAALAQWKHAVSPTAETLCKGLAVPLSDGTETLARLSVFVEPTHFVELARASNVPALHELARGFEFTGVTPQLFESAQAGDARFALALGPFDQRDADALRWQVLAHGLEAKISHGLDYVSSPHPMQ